MIRLVAIVLAAILVPVSALLATDTVVLKSGVLLEGKVESLDAESLKLTFIGGQSIVQRDQIAAIHFDKTAEQVRQIQPAPGVPVGPAPASQPGQPPAPTVTPVTPVAPTPPTVAPQADDLGVWKASGDLRARVTALRIGRVQVRDLLGRPTDTNESYLVVELELQNTSDHKDVKFRVPPFGQPFMMRDDQFRPIAQDFATGEVVGAMRSPSNIPPGGTVRHIELFSRDVRQSAREVFLRVDASVFGQREPMEFRFLASSISR